MTDQNAKPSITAEEAGILIDRLNSACPKMTGIADQLTRNRDTASIIPGLDTRELVGILQGLGGDVKQPVELAGESLENVGLLSPGDAPKKAQFVGAACDVYFK